MNAPSLVKQPINGQEQMKFRSRRAKNEKFSLLLIGSSNFCDLMSDSIHSMNELGQKKLEITIAKSENLESVLAASVSLHVDIIIFLMNTSHRHCIEQVERNICLVEPTYLCDRIILINASNHLSLTEIGLSYDELFNLSQKYRLHMFHGNIMNEHNCNQLASRILNYAVIVTGVNSGMPMTLDFPSDKFPIY